jgi:hypothetical protein
MYVVNEIGENVDLTMVTVTAHINGLKPFRFLLFLAG